MAMRLVSHSPHVHQLTSLSYAVTVTPCDMTFCDYCHTFCDSVTCHVIFPMLHLSNKRKGKEILNNDLAILPSHNTTPLLSFLVPRNFPTTCSMGQPCYPSCCHLLLSIL